VHAYDRYGEGPAVIFIGGVASYRAIDAASTQTARRLAAEGFTTVDYDRRGRGRSGDTQPWALDREVEDVPALITAAGGAAALCTSSSGADIALAAASAGAGVTALVCTSRRCSPVPAAARIWPRWARCWPTATRRGDALQPDLGDRLAGRRRRWDGASTLVGFTSMPRPRPSR
jgi:pimeloyl-ACP methyl ester carboxylesterase